MFDKRTYRSAMEHIRPHAGFEENTLSLLQKRQNGKQKEGFYMKTKKLGLIYGGVAACLLLLLGGYALFHSRAVPPQGTVPPISGKAIVNIDGVIDEVSEDGLSFRIGGLWVRVDENTIYGIPGPNALPPEEQLVSATFLAGNAVSGYTEDDPATGSVYALRIYNNFPPQE